MIDIRRAREHPDELRRALARKGAAELFDDLLVADREWRVAASSRAEDLRARTKPRGKPSEDERAALSALRDELRTAEAVRDEIEQRRSALLLAVPNPPDDDCPDGATDDDAVELRRVGDVPAFSFEPRDHVEIGEIAGGAAAGLARPGLDLERGARLSGSRFAYRRGTIALLELSLYRYALDELVRQGFEPVLPPVLVREAAMYGTGFLPNDEVNLYRVERDDLYLTGTSEVALAGLHQDEILPAAALPLRYAGYSTNFRREAGSAGRDTRGIFRVHQFDKVEMFFYVLPEASKAIHEEILSIEESIVQSLGLAYRVVLTAAGDLGPSAAKKYDLEAWIPSQQRYREITSCSNTTDFQARRLNVRYRDGDGTLRFPHTLNGTAMTARVMVALLETYQDGEGRVAVPPVLHPFGAPAVIGGD